MKLSELMAPMESNIRLRRAQRQYLVAFDRALERRDPLVMDALVAGLARDLWKLGAVVPEDHPRMILADDLPK